MMRSKTLAHRALVVIAAMLFAASQPALAQTRCTATMDSFEFGSVPVTSASTLTGTVTVTCRSEASLFNSDIRVSYCLSIGDGSGGGGPSLTPRWLRNGTEIMLMDLAHDANFVTPVGSLTSPATVPVSGTMSYAVTGWQPTTMTNRHTVHARIPVQPNVAIGGYRSQYDGFHTALSYRYTSGYQPAPPTSCQVGGTAGSGSAVDLQAPFTIGATVQPDCYFSAIDPLDFGAVTGLPGAAVAATARISMVCRRGTDFQLSLDNGLHAQGQNRRMRNGASGYAQYELFRDAAMTQRFGQTVNVDRLPGTGTGTSQSVTVHGRMPGGQNLAPGQYSDRVVVTVTY